MTYYGRGLRSRQGIRLYYYLDPLGKEPVGFSTFFLLAFVSHDCRPNCTFLAWSWDVFDSEGGGFRKSGILGRKPFVDLIGFSSTGLWLRLCGELRVKGCFFCCFSVWACTWSIGFDDTLRHSLGF